MLLERDAASGGAAAAVGDFHSGDRCENPKDEDRRVYWIWLSLALGEGNPLAEDIRAIFHHPETFYRMGKERYERIVLKKGERERLESTTLDQAKRVLEQADRLGMQILTPDMPTFPVRLLNIYTTPLVLYVKGDLGEIDQEAAIAVVGTRKMTDYGRRAAFTISYELAREGAVVIAGMARGIDTQAHLGCLKANGKTIVVLGSGLDVPYPPENARLQEIVEQRGAVVSEYPPGSPPIGKHFPVRNRIISGLSLGVVVAEADGKSGSLITANLALDQGKDVFAVPGSIFSENSQGILQLLRQGALPAANAHDILSQYAYRFVGKRTFGEKPRAERPEGRLPAGHPLEEEDRSTPPRILMPAAVKIPRMVKAPLPPDMDPSAAILYRLLDRAPKHLEELVEQSGEPVSQVLRVLTSLEMAGVAEVSAGRRYAAKFVQEQSETPEEAAPGADL